MLEGAAIFLAVGLYGALHSLLATRAVKLRARALLGPRAHRLYRLVYNAFALASFVPVFLLLALYPGQVVYEIPWPWAALLLAGQAACLLLLVVGLLQTDLLSFLGLRQLGEGEGSEPQPLRVVGLNRWVRHPLYSAGLLLIWLSPVMTTGVLALNLALTAYIAVGYRLEECRLHAMYGQAYAEYQARVPALLPRFPRRSPTT